MLIKTFQLYPIFDGHLNLNAKAQVVSITSININTHCVAHHRVVSLPSVSGQVASRYVRKFVEERRRHLRRPYHRWVGAPTDKHGRQK
jgi:hypothetical protein